MWIFWLRYLRQHERPSQSTRRSCGAKHKSYKLFRRSTTLARTTHTHRSKRTLCCRLYPSLLKRLPEKTFELLDRDSAVRIGLALVFHWLKRQLIRCVLRHHTPANHSSNTNKYKEINCWKKMISSAEQKCRCFRTKFKYYLPSEHLACSTLVTKISYRHRNIAFINNSIVSLGADDLPLLCCPPTDRADILLKPSHPRNDLQRYVKGVKVKGSPCTCWIIFALCFFNEERCYWRFAVETIRTTIKTTIHEPLV